MTVCCWWESSFICLLTYLSEPYGPRLAISSCFGIYRPLNEQSGSSGGGLQTAWSKLTVSWGPHILTFWLESYVKVWSTMSLTILQLLYSWIENVAGEFWWGSERFYFSVFSAFSWGMRSVVLMCSRGVSTVCYSSLVSHTDFSRILQGTEFSRYTKPERREFACRFF